MIIYLITSNDFYLINGFFFIYLIDDFHLQKQVL